LAFCFVFVDDAAQIRLGEMIQRMAGTISESADADYIITSIPMNVGSNAICVNSDWIDALYWSDTLVSSIGYVSNIPSSHPTNTPSKQKPSIIDDIISELRNHRTYEDIAAEMHLAARHKRHKNTSRNCRPEN
jgi:hypothetical protein